MRIEDEARERLRELLGKALQAEEDAKIALNRAFKTQIDAYLAEIEVNRISGNKKALRRSEKALRVLIARGRGSEAIVRDALYVGPLSRLLA